MPHSENHLLASLSPGAFDQLRPHLISIELKHGAVMTRPNERFERVYFPITGFISLVVELSDGSMIETGMVGRDGVLGGGSGPRRPASLDYVACASARPRMGNRDRTCAPACVGRREIPRGAGAT